MRINEPYTIFPRTLASGKVVYYYQARDEHGRRTSAKSTGCDTLPKAKRYCQKLFNQGLLIQNKLSKFSLFVNEFFADDSEYVLWRKANGTPIKPETLRAYNKSLKNQILPYFADMPLDTINANVVKKWIVWCSNQWSAKTINNAQGVLNIIFESAIDKEYLTVNPLRNIGMREVKKKERTLLSVTELNQIYHAHWASNIHRQMFLLACCTGMRIGEISALQKQDLFDGFLHVQHTYSDKFGTGSTKTNVCRYVPIPDNFDFPESKTNWCFEGKDNKPLLPHTIYNGLVRLCESLGIDCKARGITVHSLRNFFISYLQGENINLQKIKAIVGHADKDMTEHYTYWKPDMFPEVIEIQKKLVRDITQGE